MLKRFLIFHVKLFYDFSNKVVKKHKNTHCVKRFFDLNFFHGKPLSNVNKILRKCIGVFGQNHIEFLELR